MNSKTDLRFSNLFEYRILYSSKDIPPENKVKMVGDSLVGIEIEAEGVRFIRECGDKHLSSQFNEYWGTKEERSLRDAGCEFVSTPIAGQQIPHALNVLYDYTKACGAKLKFNDRTGIHVHINFRDGTVGEFLTFYYTYILFEKELFAFSGGRDKNIFTLPVRDSQSDLRAIQHAFSSFYDQSKSEYYLNRFMNPRHLIVESILSGRKYLALNYNKIPTFGTLEFRHMIGTDDNELVCNWINLIYRLREFSKSASFLEIKKEIFLLNSTSQYDQFAQSIFKEQLDLINNSKLWNNMARGVSFLKTLEVNPYDVYVQDTPRGKPIAPFRMKVAPPKRNPNPLLEPLLDRIDEIGQDRGKFMEFREIPEGAFKVKDVALDVDGPIDDRFDPAKLRFVIKKGAV